MACGQTRDGGCFPGAMPSLYYIKSVESGILDESKGCKHGASGEDSLTNASSFIEIHTLQRFDVTSTPRCVEQRGELPQAAVTMALGHERCWFVLAGKAITLAGVAL